MPRSPRADEAGELYHALNRGERGPRGHSTFFVDIRFRDCMVILVGEDQFTSD